MSPPRSSAADVAALRLERMAGLLSAPERPPFWAGVLAGLKLADVLDEGHTADLLAWVQKNKVTG